MYDEFIRRLDILLMKFLLPFVILIVCPVMAFVTFAVNNSALGMAYLLLMGILILIWAVKHPKPER